MSDLADGNLGAVGQYHIKFEAGKLVLAADAALGPAVAKMEIAVDSAKVLDALAAAIPGTIDDAVLSLIKAALAGA